LEDGAEEVELLREAHGADAEDGAGEEDAAEVFAYGDDGEIVCAANVEADAEGAFAGAEEG
jgi:hypothetical protein